LKTAENCVKSGNEAKCLWGHSGFMEESTAVDTRVCSAPAHWPLEKEHLGQRVDGEYIALYTTDLSQNPLASLPVTKYYRKFAEMTQGDAQQLEDEGGAVQNFRFDTSYADSIRCEMYSLRGCTLGGDNFVTRILNFCFPLPME